MTEPQSTEEQTDAQQDNGVIEPQDGGPADPGYPTDEPDPVTARQQDPAAMSEHERNLRQAEQYGMPPQSA